MVDVSGKAVTARTAVARGRGARCRPRRSRWSRRARAAKGDVLGVARLAGIMAAKRTAELIPLCHPLALTSVAVDFDADARRRRVRDRGDGRARPARPASRWRR